MLWLKVQPLSASPALTKDANLLEVRSAAAYQPHKRAHSSLYVHAKCTCKNGTQSKRKEKDPGWSSIDTNSSEQKLLFVVGEDDAGTYLHYILPAHPDHNCEKDALVRRQRGPEGSYPSLSGR